MEALQGGRKCDTHVQWLHSRHQSDLQLNRRQYIPAPEVSSSESSMSKGI